jgi:hypothetical protein
MHGMNLQNPELYTAIYHKPFYRRIYVFEYRVIDRSRVNGAKLRLPGIRKIFEIDK